MARHAPIRRDHDGPDARAAAAGAAAPGRTTGAADAPAGTASEAPAGGATARRPDEERVGPAAARERFGGTNWGACFFGWLVAVGLSVLLAAIVSAVATAVGTGLDWSLSDAEANAAGIGLGAAVAIAVIMFVGYYAGGYVAGRMSRFQGARQGVGVWVIGLLATLVAAGVTAAFGQRYDVLGKLDLPSLDVSSDQLGTGAVVTAVALLAVTLVAAVLGAAVGRRYHRRVDAVVATRPLGD